MNTFKYLNFYEETLPSVLPLPKKGISLEADMLLGWCPKFIKPAVPLYYDDEVYSELCKKNCTVVYQGYRPQDTYAFHQCFAEPSSSYPFDFSDKNIAAYNFFNKKKKRTQDPVGMTAESPEDSLVFDSFFEGGNLDQAVRVSAFEYDLYMRPDTNTSGHMHWFYFSVTNFLENQVYKFNIVNFSRDLPLYKEGMKPKQFSTLRTKKGESSGWENFGENLNFGTSKLNKHLDPNCNKQFFMLSFEFSVVYPEDKIWIATNEPYTYSRLWKVLESLKQDDSTYELSHITVSSLGKSLSLADIPLVTVTNPANLTKKKRVVLAIGRVHPSETVGSWVIEGFLRFICSRVQEARVLRDNFVFKVLPMCNPDGVILGNSRTGLSGKDLNRCYLIDKDKNKAHPEVKLIKNIVEKILESGYKIFMFLDFHGHLAKKGAFMYGPSYPLHDANYFKTKVFPKLMSEKTCVFRYFSSRFIVDQAKNSTARMVMWKDYGITYSYTLETSCFGYLNEFKETKVFELSDFYALAEILAWGVYEVYVIKKEEKGKDKMKKNLKMSDYGIFKRTGNGKSREKDCQESDKNDKSLIETKFESKVPVDIILQIKFDSFVHAEHKLDDIIQVSFS